MKNLRIERTPEGVKLTLERKGQPTVAATLTVEEVGQLVPLLALAAKASVFLFELELS